jgi:hypothetical protein
VAGGAVPTSSGQFSPLPDEGVPPLPDPLADLLTPDQLGSLPDRGSITVGSADERIQQGSMTPSRSPAAGTSPWSLGSMLSPAG